MGTPRRLGRGPCGAEPCRGLRALAGSSQRASAPCLSAPQGPRRVPGGASAPSQCRNGGEGEGFGAFPVPLRSEGPLKGPERSILRARPPQWPSPLGTGTPVPSTTPVADGSAIPLASGQGATGVAHWGFSPNAAPRSPCWRSQRLRRSHTTRVPLCYARATGEQPRSDSCEM